MVLTLHESCVGLNLVYISDRTWGQFNSGIGIDYLKKIELELRNFEL